MHRKLVVDMNGLIALVMPERRPWYALLLDAKLDEHHPGVRHVPILAINLADTSSESDYAVPLPGGGTLGLWFLEGYQLRFAPPPGSPRPAQAVGGLRQPEFPSGGDEEHITWIPNLGEVAGPQYEEVDPRCGGTDAPAIVASRFIIESGLLASTWHDESRVVSYDFHDDHGNGGTGLVQAVADGIQLAAHLDDADPWPTLTLTSLRSNQPKAARSISLSPRDGIQVRIVVSCLPSPQPPRTDRGTTIPHFKHYYSVSRNGHALDHDRRPYPQERPHRAKDGGRARGIETVPCTPGVLK